MKPKIFVMFLYLLHKFAALKIDINQYKYSFATLHS